MRILFVLFMAACSSEAALDRSTTRADATTVDCALPATSAPCTDSVDCAGGEACCVASTGNVCVALDRCSACGAVVACRPTEMTCQALGIGGCYEDAELPGNHCASY